MERGQPGAADRPRPAVHGRAPRAGQRAGGGRPPRTSSTGAATPTSGSPTTRARTVSATFTAAARRGADVRGLLWRSHWNRLGFHSEKSRAARHRDRRGRRPVPARHAGAHRRLAPPEVRRAAAPGRPLARHRLPRRHRPVPQPPRRHRARGRPPGGPDATGVRAAAGLARRARRHARGRRSSTSRPTFRERWEDSTPLTLNPGRLLSSLARREDLTPATPDRAGAPAALARRGRTEAVQVLRTYPAILPKGYDFAPAGGAQRGPRQHQGRARTPGGWSTSRTSTSGREEVGQALRRRPCATTPSCASSRSSRWCRTRTARSPCPPQLYGRRLAMDHLLEAGGDRVAVYGLTSEAGYPIYVHAKVCVIDDVWASVGSDNFNRRSWSSDSEIACAVQDTRVDGPRRAGAAGRVRPAAAARARRRARRPRPRRRARRPRRGLGPHGVDGHGARRVVCRGQPSRGAVATCRAPRRRSRARACAGGDGPGAWQGAAGVERPPGRLRRLDATRR